MTKSPSTLFEVHVELARGTARAGTAFVSVTRGELTTVFDYDPAYLARKEAFEISPELSMSSGSTVVAGLPGALADSAPDRWGRNMIKKRLQADNREQGRRAQSVTEIDYLLGVSDCTRQGALRYCLESGAFLAPDNDVPKLIEVPRLMNAADIVDREAAGSDELAAIEILLDAGSGSLGGARPKASVRDGDRLWMAKFPRASDEWDVMAWEMTALDLAEVCGIKTPTRRLVDVAGKQVLLLERFDREVSQRIPYISAMTLLRARDGDRREYIEIAEALQVVGSAVRGDLQELWRRIAFSIAINNTDDHLRNHGFLRRGRGWRLSPAFDVNPNPDLGEHRMTSINFVTDHENAVDALTEAGEHFDLDKESAKTIWSEVRSGVAGWRAVAAKHGIDGHEIRLFSEAFESLA